MLHPGIAAVSFVGSTPIAEYIQQQGVAHGKRVQALGGAKNHMVVMPDADLDQAADALVGAAYGSAGERCMAISVGVAVGHIADELIAKLKPRIAALRIRDGMESDADMGPVVTSTHREKILAYIESGIAEGAQLVCDGRRHAVPGREGGFFLGATLFDHARPDMKIYREEIFGPVLTMVRVPDFAAALQLVNGHEFGNGVACYTTDGGTAREFARRVNAGMVGINVPIPVPMAFHSFGGWKRSLFGDHHAYGEEGVRFYTRYKSVMQRWPDAGCEQGTGIHDASESLTRFTRPYRRSTTAASARLCALQARANLTSLRLRPAGRGAGQRSRKTAMTLRLRAHAIALAAWLLIRPARVHSPQPSHGATG